MTETAWTRYLTPDLRERLTDRHKPWPWISSTGKSPSRSPYGERWDPRLSPG